MSYFKRKYKNKKHDLQNKDSRKYIAHIDEREERPDNKRVRT